MSQPGMGVMLGFLSGNEETVNTFKGALNKVIAEAQIDADGGGGDGALVLRFTDGSGIEIYDGGRSCCENRYITCDDDLSALAGKPLTDVEMKNGPDESNDYDVHETCFVEVRAGDASVVLTTHNEHNGYYGGFWMTVRSLSHLEAAQ